MPYDPASDLEHLTSFGVLAKPHPKVCGHHFASRRGNSFGHSLIKQGGDDTPVDNSAQTFPFDVRNPTRRGGAVRINTKFELKAMWVVSTTSETGPLELHTVSGCTCRAGRGHYATLPTWVCCAGR